jgi:hypothetical protein
MVPDPHYGSSEYSSEAEELFARFVLEHERGEAPDFEALCDANPDLCDELYGLHADWDNVRGLLARLEGQRAASNPAAAPTGTAPAEALETEPQPGPRAEAPSAEGPQARPEGQAGDTATPTLPEGGAPSGIEVPFSPADVPVPEALARRVGTWKRAAVVGAVASAALAVWSLDLHRTRTVLAEESRTLRVESESTRGALLEAERRASELDEAQRRLDAELSTAREERERLASRGTSLEQDLAAERDRKAALEREQESLRRALEEERDRTRAAAEEAARLGLQRELEDLLREERGLWPSVPGTASRLADWLTRARELDGRPGADGTSPLRGEDGLLARVALRLERLEACEAALEDEAWAEVVRALEGTPAADLAPRFGLRPLGADPATGLQRFLDLRTRTGAEDGLEFQLVPGLELPGGGVEPFFLASAPWDEEVRRHLLGGSATPEGVPDPGPEARRALDLARLGYRAATSAEVALARRAGVEVAPWTGQPVLPARAPR